MAVQALSVDFNTRGEAVLLTGYCSKNIFEAELILHVNEGKQLSHRRA